jgi:hypothetical protein
MNEEQLCSEHEAARIAGVSLRTLLRFSEAGYLALHKKLDGEHRYERAQVEEIFGAPGTLTSEATAVPTQQPRAAITSELASNSEQPTSVNPAEEVENPVEHEAPLLYSDEELDHAADTGRDAQMTLLSDEIARLRNLLAMQERILDSKDDEIADLRSQRAWLRERIEKLEEKSDRDQILLLSETQMIRSLIAYQESRKSTFRQFLEWTGLARDVSSTSLPQPQSSDYSSKSAGTPGSARTIDVSKAANSD